MHELRSRPRRRNISTLGCAYTLCLAACQGTSVPDADSQQGHDEPGSGSHQAALSSATSCGPLLGRLQAELLDQVDERAEQARRGATNYYPYPDLGGVAGSGGFPSVDADSPLPAQPPPPSSGNAPTAPTNDAASGAVSPGAGERWEAATDGVDVGQRDSSDGARRVRSAG